MMHYYSTVDNIILTHSDIKETNYLETITLYFERKNKDGVDDIAEIILPTYCVVKIKGFTDTEVVELKDYALHNAPLIWELAIEYREKAK